MKISVNGVVKEFDVNASMVDIVNVELNGKEPKGIAVALNDTILPKSKWSETILKENDRIEIVHAVQGG
ncbi:MAG: sulfur carrier protein ThiS [Ignavibacteria bacterium]|nr:sulfur carrier protein ThiS [Ignavibacteria bacterium]